MIDNYNFDEYDNKHRPNEFECYIHLLSVRPLPTCGWQCLQSSPKTECPGEAAIMTHTVNDIAVRT